MNEGYRLNVSEMLGLEEVQRNRSSQRLEEVVVELYATMRSPLLSYAYQVACSSGDAEDLVQIAFLKLYDQLRSRAPIENARSWLYRVVHNAAIDQLRHQGKQESLAAEWLAGNPAPPTSAEDDLILQQRVAQSLSLLNERERHCLLLRADGLSYKEISEVLSISVKAVSVYLVRGLKKIGGRSESRA
jgi:RNA polymerase sigma-70 factor, ECF subfamily